MKTSFQSNGLEFDPIQKIILNGRLVMKWEVRERVSGGHILRGTIYPSFRATRKECVSHYYQQDQE